MDLDSNSTRLAHNLIPFRPNDRLPLYRAMSASASRIAVLWTWNTP